MNSVILGLPISEPTVLAIPLDTGQDFPLLFLILVNHPSPLL